MVLKESDISEKQNKPLSNLRIAITAVDLEQSEHRGIAHLSKSLIGSLSQQGAEVYLLTGFRGKRLNPIMKLFMSKISVNEVESADILDQLSDPKINIHKKTSTSGDEDIDLFLKLYEYIVRFKKNSDKILSLLSLLKPILNCYIKRFTFSGQVIHLNDLKSSPYWGKERIDYLQYIKGFISIPDIFTLTTLRSRRLILRSPIIDLRKSKIDVLITTCPLSVDVKSTNKNSTNILQMIMDFIPLSFSKHPDHPYYFYNRLQDSMKSRCCFISQTSRDKICSLLDKSHNFYQKNIIYPMPSLNIETLKAAATLNNIRGIDYKFILFNSSVVPRKNLHFLINAFRSSKAIDRGFKLCVAGKIHNDNYGMKVKELCDEDSSLILLDYVQEIEKAWLFLNAHAFSSPSCVEGFGIPVLDAYLLGLNVLASNIPSHREIENIFSENNQFRLLDLTDMNRWISSLNDITDKNLLYNASREERISTFDLALTNYQKSFDRKLSELILM
tara:strand:+ start:1090 stop:2592 length:1503 start_codon:yes stop_codon:yes gene_type:complete